jgi:predicted DNA-binding ArsR family transcriptional regulator
MLTLTFAEEQIYRIHERDLLLYSNTGIWDLLEITINENNQLIPNNTYVPRYVDTFSLFMRHLRGYQINLRYLSTTKINIKILIEMLVSDNLVYKVRTMDNVINDLAYIICPKILSIEQLLSAFNRKDIEYQAKSMCLWSELQILKNLDESDKPDEQKIDNKIQYMPHRYLIKQITKFKEKKSYEVFKTDINVKLPIILIELVKIISSATGKALSKNFETNIKQRIKNDPDLVSELYQKLSDLGLLHTLMAFIGCLTSLASDVQ